jgi:hypothetical protein
MIFGTDSQTRMHPAIWESPSGFKCQTLSTSLALPGLGFARCSEDRLSDVTAVRTPKHVQVVFGMR